MPPVSRILGSIACFLAADAAFWLAKTVYKRLTSPIRSMAGPDRRGLVLGDVGKHMNAWRAQFGPTFRYPGVFGTQRLHTSDVLALQHILKNADIYQRPALMRKSLQRGVLGKGLVVAEGEEHKNLRKIMNPAFGVAQIRELGEIFVNKSIQLRDNWLEDLSGGPTRIDVLTGLRNMTLDVIALAGFNYDCDSLNNRRAAPTELAEAFAAYFHTPMSRHDRLLQMVQVLFPVLLLLPLPGNKVLERARASLERIGRMVLKDSKAALDSAADEKYMTRRRDLLSLLLKSNMAADVPANQRLGDEVVIAQLSTFFVAGHETTSNGTAWALYELALAPDVQAKLRAELRTVGTETPSVDALNALPYLENIVKEVLRLHAPIGFTTREAMRDDVIPLRRPYMDSKGQAHDSIVVAKGQLIYVPILGIQRDPELWGPDAEDFRPERWDALPQSVNDIPGVYGHLLAFLSGPHNCIGAKFALAEMKALLFTLVRAFEFEMVVPKDDVGRTTSPVGQPLVLSEKEKGTQMPLRLRVVHLGQ
ncbi:cytochrome P450 [Mycena latifolia]|nr:cytochrome P450 [Mycena latifolia]